MPHVTRVAPKFRYDTDPAEVVLYMSADLARAVLNAVNASNAAVLEPVREVLTDAMDGPLSQGEMVEASEVDRQSIRLATTPAGSDYRPATREEIDAVVARHEPHDYGEDRGTHPPLPRDRGQS